MFVGALPWWSKIAAKLLLSRLPLPYGLWKKLNLFALGSMEDPSYASRVFDSHFRRVKDFMPRGFVCIEVGPGDSLLSAVFAIAQGASRTYLIDAGPYASDDIEPYRRLANDLTGIEPPLRTELSAATSVERLVRACGGVYLTEGVQSWAGIESSSVDYIWSEAVLEHVRVREFPSVLKEMRRVLKDTGVASHHIDLRDHLGGALNNLRFPDRIWEADWFAGSGFYTNRIGFDEMCGMFRSAGFEVQIPQVDRWESLPTSRRAMAERFQERPDHDLLVSGFDMILRPAQR